MTLHAVENVGDAFAVTRAFLFPFDVRQWLKLAIVAFFVGAATNLPTAQFDTRGTRDRAPETASPTFDPEIAMPVVVAVVAAIIVLALLFALVGAIMEFVLVESLRRGEVSMRRYWSERWRQGLRLFGFRIAIGLPVLALVVGWLALVLVPLFTDAAVPELSIGLFLLGIPVLFVVGVLVALVYSFTTVFVVPIMIREDCGVLAGWRRLWPSIRGAWKEYLAYVVVAFLLTVATGILASFLVGLGALVVLLPLALVAALTHLTVSLTSTAGLVVLALLVLLFVIALAAIWALVQVPILTYLRYYALLVLGDVEPSLDLVSEQRSAVRD